jgi:hypothetical protein
MDAYSVDTAAANRPPFVQSTGEGNSTPVLGEQIVLVLSGTTAMHSLQFRASAGTQLESEKRAAIDEASTEGDASAVPSQTRARLIGLKYRGQSSAEDLARLEILTSRLQQLSPRTTAVHFSELERAVSSAEVLRAELDAIGEEYGL